MNEKRRSHKQALLELLSDGELHHMNQMLRVGGFRYGGRLFELRKAGHAIETVKVGEDEFMYRLLPAEPKQLQLV